MTETYYLISSWLESWNRKFSLSEKESLRNLLFDKSFINIARAATVALENHYLIKPEIKIQKNQKNSWGRDLLEYLENYYKNNSLVLDILKAEFKKDIEKLGKELNKGSYDIEQIYPILERIKIGLSNKTVGNEFIKELKLKDKANLNKMDYLADVLLQDNLSKYGLNNLKDLPQRSVARHGAKLFLSDYIDKLIAERKLSIQLWNGFIKFLSEEVNKETFKEMFDLDSDSIFKLIKHYHWQSLMRRFLKDLSITFVDEISELKLKGSNESIATKIEKNKVLHKKIGLSLLSFYVPSVIKAILHSITTKPARDENSDLSRNLLIIGDWLKTNADFADNRTRPYGHRPDIVDLVATQSFASSANTFISDFLFDETDVKSETKIISDVGKRICAYFAKDVRESDYDWKIISHKHLETFCDTWSAKTILHKNLGLIFSKTNDLLIKKLPSITDTAKSNVLLNKKSKRQKFWQEWFSKFISYSGGFNSHIYHYFPWSKITEGEKEKLFISVFDDFVDEKEEWSAIFIINNLNSKGEIWEIADIKFFDPKDFDFGERVWFSSKIDEKVTFAKVDVLANSSRDAALKGWLRLNNVLNESAFVLSINQSYGGFEVDIHPDIFVTQTRTKNWSAGWSLTQRDRPIQQSNKSFESFVMPVMDKLFEKEKNNLPFTGLETKFVTALHWYNKGRWKKDAAESYIFYWIGIEILFGESGQEKLFNTMSKLAINWRNAYSYGLYFLHRHRHDLVKMINEDPKVKKIVNSNPNLKDWDKYYSVLLNYENAELLHSIIPKRKKKVKDYAQSYNKYLKPFVDDKSAYLEEVDLMRSDYRFKLFLLKDLRNRMTHQGIFYQPEMIFYAEELQSIFEDFLDKFADVAINQHPQITDLDDLIKESNELLIS